MKKQFLKRIRGFDIYAFPESNAENPYTDGQPRPPVSVFRNDSLEGYADGRVDDTAITVERLVTYIPAAECVELIKEYGDAHDAARAEDGVESDIKARLVKVLNKNRTLDPQNWEDARSYFTLLNELARRAKIVSICKIVNDDSCKVIIFVALTPDWLCSSDVVEQAYIPYARRVADMYAAWVSGHVYGFYVAAEGDDKILQMGCDYYGDVHSSGLLCDAEQAVKRCVRDLEPEF